MPASSRSTPATARTRCSRRDTGSSRRRPVRVRHDRRRLLRRPARHRDANRCTDTDCGRALAHLADTDFAGWFDVDFGASSSELPVSVRLASGRDGQREPSRCAPVRRPGPVLARIPVSSTGGWQDWVTRTRPVALVADRDRPCLPAFRRSGHGSGERIRQRELAAIRPLTSAITGTGAFARHRQDAGRALSAE